VRRTPAACPKKANALAYARWKGSTEVCDLNVVVRDEFGENLGKRRE
jgi:hypothetical protein